MTKKALFEKMNGKRVKVNYENMFTTDQNEELRQSIVDKLLQHGKTIDDLIEDDRVFRVVGFNEIWYKSKLVQNDTGIFKVRSADYIFKRDRDKQDVYGNIPKSEEMEILPNENGFKRKGMKNNQWIIYEII